MCADCSTAVAGSPAGGYRERMRWLCLALVALLAAGCATAAFPDEVMRAVNTRITAEQLRADPAALKGARVIVGGEILATQPSPGQTEIELLTRRLRDDNSPERSDRSPGRLLLRTPDFLDPAVYAPGRRLTVIGTVTGGEERKIGDVPYRYPVITVEQIRLWAKEVVVSPAYAPYPWPWGYGPYGPYYDPFYLGPRGPYYPGWWW